MSEEKIEYVVVKAEDVGLALRRKSVVDAEIKAKKQKEKAQVFEVEKPKQTAEKIYNEKEIEDTE